MHKRIERTWTNHPLVSLGTIATLVTIIVAVAPFVFGWLKNFDTVEDAKRREDHLLALIVAHQANDIRVSAWASLQAIKNEQVALRNRVNDCDIRLEKRETMSPLERQACAQYRAENEDATRRFNEARRAALETTKEK